MLAETGLLRNRAAVISRALVREEIDRAMPPPLFFHEQLKEEEVEAYEQMKGS